MKRIILFAFILLFGCMPQHVVELADRPCLMPYEDNDFILCKTFHLIIDDMQYSVPQGFITDLSSIPRILWPIYSPNDSRTIGASIMHDYMYSCPYNQPRQEIDALFYSALIGNGTSVLTAYFYWVGVRAFGRPYFKEGYQCIYAYNKAQKKASS